MFVDLFFRQKEKKLYITIYNICFEVKFFSVQKLEKKSKFKVLRCSYRAYGMLKKVYTLHFENKINSV